MMASVLEIAREILGDRSDMELRSAIWNWTGYPSFWDGDPETCFREQLAFYRDTVECPACFGWLNNDCETCNRTGRIYPEKGETS